MLHKLNNGATRWLQHILRVCCNVYPPVWPHARVICCRTSAGVNIRPIYQDSYHSSMIHGVTFGQDQVLFQPVYRNFSSYHPRVALLRQKQNYTRHPCVLDKRLRNILANKNQCLCLTLFITYGKVRSHQSFLCSCINVHKH